MVWLEIVESLKKAVMPIHWSAMTLHALFQVGRGALHYAARCPSVEARDAVAPYSGGGGWLYKNY